MVVLDGNLVHNAERSACQTVFVGLFMQKNFDLEVRF